METNVSSQCYEGEDEIVISNRNQATKQPETISSSNDAKHDKTTSSVYARTFVSVQSFKTRDEFLSAMIEDVTDWLNSLFILDIKSHELMHHLDTGVLLCRLANIIEGLMVGGGDDEKRDSVDGADRGTPVKSKDEGGGMGRGGATSDDVRRSVATRPLVATSGNSGGGVGAGGVLVFRENAPRGSFQSRDNISNFLNWCRNRLKLADTVLFETEDLVAGRNERNVILCLLEVARRGSKHGMIVPELIELETEIDAELDEESMAEDEVEVERLAKEVEEEVEEESSESSDDDESDGGGEMEQATTSASDLGAPCEAAVVAAEEGSIEEVSEAMVSALLESGRNEVELTTDRNDPELTTNDRNDPELTTDGNDPELTTTTDRSDLKLTTSYLVSSAVTSTTPSPRSGMCLRLRDLLRMHEHRRSEIQRCMRHSIQVDMLTLDELVRRFLGNCRCQHPYPMIKISDGRYRVGDNLMLIFVRMLRNHVMLRIGGGWETLADYLRRHDPCRASSEQQQIGGRRATHTCTHAILENAPWNDDTTIASSGTSSSEEDVSTAENGKGTQEKDEDKPTEEDKDKTEKGKTTEETEENASEEDDDTRETTDSTKQQEQTLNISV